jgi:hypothetical protein
VLAFLSVPACAKLTQKQKRKLPKPEMERQKFIDVEEGPKGTDVGRPSAAAVILSFVLHIITLPLCLGIFQLTGFYTVQPNEHVSLFFRSRFISLYLASSRVISRR